MRARFLPFLFLIAASFTGCKKSEDLATGTVSEYTMPLSAGHYAIYRLDSTVFINFGTNPEVHSYQEKHLVDAQVPDALGRPSWRVFRYLRDTAGTQPWSPAGTYFITVLDRSMELIENNLRYIRLQAPLRTDFSWKAYRYLPDNPLRAAYQFQNDFDMESWDFTYGETDGTETLNGKSYDHVLTVNGIDRTTNMPITPADPYASIEYQKYQYAEGIGMISEEWIMWDYQWPHDNITVSQKHGFGVKRTLMDHN